jgi:membrane protease YdiL (CAAX protease family)
VLATSFLGFEILAGTAAHAMAGGDDHAAMLWMLGFQSAARVVWFIFAVAHLLLRGATMTDLGWDASRLKDDLIVGGWLWMAAILPVFSVQLFFTQVLKYESHHPLIELAQDGPTLAMMIGATIAAAVIAPWVEEFVFRVVLQGWLEGEQVRLRQERDPEADERPGYAPLVIASLVFAGLHFSNGPDPIAIFVLSLFLGYAYRQTHRITPSLVIHAGINGWTMLNLWIMYCSA